MKLGQQTANGTQGMRFCTSADASDIKLSIAKRFPENLVLWSFPGI